MSPATVIRAADVGQRARVDTEESVGVAHGFEPTPGILNWGEVFQPSREEVVGRKVAVIGNFPSPCPPNSS